MPYQSLRWSYSKNSNVLEFNLMFVFHLKMVNKHSKENFCSNMWLWPFSGPTCPFSSPIVESSAENVWTTACPAGIYLLKVNDRNTRTRWELCSKLTVKTPERGQVDTGWVPIPTDSFKILSEQYLQSTCVTVYSNKNQECSTEMLVFILVDSYHWLSSSKSHTEGGRVSGFSPLREEFANLLNVLRYCVSSRKILQLALII